ncbi:MAG: MBL fold metallo-hydrolase [Acidimicrobiia bacterium]|nr:MBL fold metallo-hydrolase [Acidimicrobiia bacterium]
MRLELGTTAIHILSCWIFNCYLIEDGGDGGPLVVDAGIPRNVRSVLDELTGPLGRSSGDIAAVVATHTHSDHVGGLPDLTRTAHAPVHLPRRAESYALGEDPRNPGLRSMLRIWPVLLDQPFDMRGLRELQEVSRDTGYGQGGPYRMPVDVAGYLDDGDRIPAATDWEVIQAPGHTDDSTCFYNPRTKVLLSGDAVLTAGGRAWFNPEYVDAGLSGDTEARLRDLDVDVLLPGHGRPLVGDDVLGDALTHTDVVPGPLRHALRGLTEQVVSRGSPARGL